MEKYTDLLLVVHIAFAFVTVIAGTVAVIARKSKSVHKSFGKSYYFLVFGTVLTAYVIMPFPGHENIMMLLIGLFNLYLVATGYRSLKFKIIFSKDKVKLFDKVLSAVMLTVAVAMIGVGIQFILGFDSWGYPLIAFGFFGLFCVYQDFKFYQFLSESNFKWMEFHATKMIGSYIGTLTGLLVTQFELQLGITAWFLPSIVGLLYIAYWVKKIRTSPGSVFDW